MKITWFIITGLILIFILVSIGVVGHILGNRVISVTVEERNTEKETGELVSRDGKDISDKELENLEKKVDNQFQYYTDGINRISLFIMLFGFMITVLIPLIVIFLGVNFASTSEKRVNELINKAETTAKSALERVEEVSIKTDRALKEAEEVGERTEKIYEAVNKAQEDITKTGGEIVKLKEEFDKYANIIMTTNTGLINSTGNEMPSIKDMHYGKTGIVGEKLAGYIAAYRPIIIYASFTILAHIISGYKSDIETLKNLAKIYFYLGQNERAVTVLEELVGICEGNDRDIIEYDMVIVKQHLGDFDGMLELLEELRIKDPENIDYIFIEAQTLYYKIGVAAKQKIVSDLKTVFRSNPDYLGSMRESGYDFRNVLTKKEMAELIEECRSENETEATSNDVEK